MKMMTFNHRAVRLLLSALLVLLMLMPMTALASEGYGRTYSYPLPVTVNVGGDKAPADAAFVIKLEAITEGAPMPSSDTLTFTGAGTQTFDAIAYSVPEDYHYKVYQVPGSTQNMDYDQTVYEVIVHVTNGEDGQLTGTIVSRVGSGEKPDSVSFANIYTDPQVKGETESESETEVKTKKKTVDKGDTNGAAKNAETKADGSVKTGDDTPIGMWFAIMLVGVVAILMLAKRRSHGAQED